MKKWSPSPCRCLKWSMGMQLTLDNGWHPWKACLLKQSGLVHRWQGGASIWWALTATFPRSSWNTRCILNWLETQNVGDRSVEHDDAIAAAVLRRVSVSIGGSGSAASIAASSSLVGVGWWWWVGEAQPRGKRDPFSTSVHRCDRTDVGSVCDQTTTSARRAVPALHLECLWVFASVGNRTWVAFHATFVSGWTNIVMHMSELVAKKRFSQSGRVVVDARVFRR